VAIARPTILQIIPRLDTGGAERTTVEITHAIAAAGGRALVVTEGGRLCPEIADAGGELVPFPAATKNPLYMAANARRLIRLITDENVDLVHARSRAPAWSALLAARRTGRPFVTTYHGAYAEHGAAKRLYNSVMARGDLVIANSRYTAGLIRDRHGKPAETIRIIPRGVDERRFDPALVSPARPRELRKRWNVAPDQRIVLLAARLTAWKGQRVLIAAAGQLEAAGALANAVVILAGDAQGRSNYVAALERQIADAGLAGRVRLVGHEADMPAAFLAAHVAVVASTEPEAFGRVVAEAGAMGCPVIATNIGAPAETIRKGPEAPAEETTGWLVPPGDAAALAACIETALALSVEARAAIGARARAHARAHFSLAAMQQSTLAVYDALIGSGMAASRIGNP
jgi:glycosyltransferase involved in cell wall biosynthesis